MKVKIKKKQKTSSWYRKECVKVAKQIVRIRDKNICQKCGRNQGALHCSHVYPEGTYHSLSADPLNMKLLCYRCHFFWWHKDVLEAKDWFQKKFPDRYIILRKLSRMNIKVDWAKRLVKLKKELHDTLQN